MVNCRFIAFLAIVRAKQQRIVAFTSILCPDNSARPALRSLLSVALSSVRALQFYHACLFLLMDGFSL